MKQADAMASKIAAKMLASEGLGSALGIKIEEVRVGYARLGMTIRGDMTNGHDMVHGGMIFTLADTAFAYACNSRNQASVAASASIIFLAPAHVGDRLVAEAVEQLTSGRSGAYRVTVTKEDGPPVAQFQGHSRTLGRQVIETINSERQYG